jgi:polyribonucleotide nucleotidyltransferase
MVERLSVTTGAVELEFETGRIAKQAHGAVICRSGDTMVLSAVTVAPEPREGQNFFPMTVDYREKFYSVGQIPGNFFRREARPSEREILVCRMTDRPLRPLFPKGFMNELMVCQTVFSADNVNNPDVLSINAASAALHISKIPLQQPIGAVRVGRIGGELVVNPEMGAMANSDLDIIIAGTSDAICMVEGDAKEVTEPDMVDALEFGHNHIRNIINAIEELRSRCGEEKMAWEEPAIEEDVLNDVTSLAEGRMKETLGIKVKQERMEQLDALRDAVMEKLKEQYGEDLYESRKSQIKEVFGDIKKRVMRGEVIETSVRMDGRQLDEVRPITIEVGVLPRAHGSCLFTRGETQAIVSTTLGTSRDEMRLDDLEGDTFRRFFLHYNFPSWSVGEVRRIMGPGRREVGHGKLAERALRGQMAFLKEEEEELEIQEGGVIAEEEERAFPYTIRIVSDVTESNGSSSMASVCGGSMSLMDAGVPVDNAVAGIAMGLINEGEEFRILTDILGDEDHLGDMDFKVCGTRNGITAFQMDTKIKGLPREVMQKALDQARQGRLFILDKMAEVLAGPRDEVSPYAPRIYTIKIDPEKIRDVIGQGGKVIRAIQTATESEIDIQDDGTINVAALDHESADKAIKMIEEITAEPEIGKVYHGTVTRLMDFGAFVQFMGSKEGLVHISEMAPGHVRQVTDVLNVGDETDVKVIEIDKMGRINLSKVQADLELGRITEEEMAEARKNSGGGDRGGRDRGGRDRGGRDRGGRSGGGGGRSGDRGGRSGGGNRGKRN